MNHFAKNSNQAGVTLLLSFLIMAGLMIITLTVTFFAVQELRQSRTSSLSEPSIVAAETGGEQGLWLIKRSTFADQCDDGTNYYQIDGTTSGNSKVRQSKCVSYGPATFELQPDEEFVFFLYDPTNINGNLCMEENPPTCDGAQLYDTIFFDYIAGNFAVTVDVVTLDNVFVGSTTLSSGVASSNLLIDRDIIGSTDERLRVVMRSPDHATVKVNPTGSIEGMPDFPTIDSIGCSAHSNIPDCEIDSEVFKRRINITVPR